MCGQRAPFLQLNSLTVPTFFDDIHDGLACLVKASDVHMGGFEKLFPVRMR